MPPKKRLPTNRPLPKRWRFKHGAYRYRVPPGLESLWEGKTEFTLGNTYAEACRVWSERLNREGSSLQTLGQVMDRYLLEVSPDKSYKSQQSDHYNMKKLRPVFGHMPIGNIKPRHAYKFHDLAKQKHGLTAAKHAIQTLRHLLTKAVEWGLISRNPLLGQVRIASAPARDRLVEDWEIREALTMKANSRGPVVAKVYMRFKLMTGLRRNDILGLSLGNLKDDGIHVQPSKTRKSTGKRLIIEWDEEGELKKLLEEIIQIPPRRIGHAPLFVARQGKSYVDEQGRCNAFDSLWQRFMDKVLKTTKVTDRFQERDLRAKVASESGSLQEASERLGHASTAITQRVYRRKPVRVKPLVR